MQTSLEKESDKCLRETVLQQIDWEPEVVSHDIGVGAKDGVVTLTGFVHSYVEKVAAEKAAKSVYGTKAVANDIEVKPGIRTDPEIARDVIHALKLDSRVIDDRIKVTVQNGYVTLEGAVEWNYQREAAENRARNVSGVRSLTNRIDVKSGASATEVKTKIEEALRRSAEVDARGIYVSAHNGTVTLEGNVRSLFEKQQAERAAWAAPGVSRVIDNIAVAP
jgi:osmotically-inducible protein OsmY